jgi:zinc-ribbon domain
MYCAQCGTQVQEGQKYCSRCGQPVSGTARAPMGPPPPLYASSSAAGYGAAAPAAGPVGATGRSRVACHLRTLGILWIVVSVLRLLPALGLLAFSHMGRMAYPFMAPHVRFFMLPMMGGLGVFLSATAAIGLAAGWGLLERRPWARILAIVIGCLSLLSFPFGTALGIYTLWVLAPAGADAEYERLARVQ